MKLSATYIALLSNAFFVESKLVRTRHSIKNTKQSEEQRLADETSASQHDEATTLSHFKHEGIEGPFKFTSDRADTGNLSRNLLSNEDTDVDVVGLSNEETEEMSECPNMNVVQCQGGYVVGSSGETTSCESACDGACCVGHLACEGFTGSVSKDGKSCMGAYACRSANIGTVCDGCHGYAACYEAGNDGRIYDGCGDFDCEKPDSINSIVHSCNADNACDSAAHGSRIYSIMHSCNAKEACYFAANSASIIPDDWKRRRRSIHIQDCCNSAEECEFATEETIFYKCMH